jgi:hypothetical protein
VVRLAEVPFVKIKVDTSALARSKWYEYLIRFAFGGAVSVLAGIVGKIYGPEIGGLFLAFPAILPASATLIENHEKRKKWRVGKEGALRAREVAGVDAAGAAMGSIGLLAFAIIVWQWIHSPAPMVLSVATLAWLSVAVATWMARDTVIRRIRLRLMRTRRKRFGI